MKSKETTISERLQRMTKEEIMDIANNLSIKIRKSDKKELLATTIVSTIQEQPMAVLSRLSREYLLHLQQMVHDPKYAVVLSYYVQYYGPLYANALTDITVEKYKVFEYTSDDLVNAVLPIIDEMVDKSRNSSRYEVEQMIIGLLNIYGILDINIITSHLNNLGVNITTDDVLDIISKSIILTDCYVREYDLFTSLFLRDVDEVFDERLKRKIKDECTLTKEQVLSMGSIICPIPLSKESTELSQFLLAKGIPKLDVGSILSYIWGQSNNELFGSNCLTEVYQSINPIFGLEIEPQSFFDVLIKYVNAIPRWILSGHSSNSVPSPNNNNLPKQAPRIVAGPNMRKAGMEIDQADVDRMWDERYATQTNKVGRNDSCPCGSGRKYKKCCGDN